MHWIPETVRNIPEKSKKNDLYYLQMGKEYNASVIYYKFKDKLEAKNFLREARCAFDKEYYYPERLIKVTPKGRIEVRKYRCIECADFRDKVVGFAEESIADGREIVPLDKIDSKYLIETIFQIQEILMISIGD